LPSCKTCATDSRSASGADAFRSTSADWQILPTRRDAADPAHATGLV